MRKTKKILLYIVFLVAVVVLMFLFLEIIFRVAGIGTEKEESFFWVKHSFYNPFLIFGPSVNVGIEQENGEKAYWNSQGFRMEEELDVEKPFNEYRVFALGGSTTENLANRQNLHYCGLSNELLSPYSFNGKYFLCVNVGKSAYSSAQTLVRLQFDLLNFEPDMITVMHNENDLLVNFFPYDERDNYANKYLYSYYAPVWSFREINPVYNSRAIIFFYRNFKNIKEKLFAQKIESGGGVVYSTMKFKDGEFVLRSKDNFRNNLVSICRIARAHDIKVVLMSQPAVFNDDKIALLFGHKVYNGDIYYPETEEFKRIFEEYNDVVKKVAEEEEVYFIDMYELMGHDQKYFKDMIHYTPEGIKKFSEIYSDKLRRIIIK